MESENEIVMELTEKDGFYEVNWFGGTYEEVARDNPAEALRVLADKLEQNDDCDTEDGGESIRAILDRDFAYKIGIFIEDYDGDNVFTKTVSRKSGIFEMRKVDDLEK